MSKPTIDSSISTIALDGLRIAGFDPRTTEVSWTAFHVAALPQGPMRSIGIDLRQLASVLWSAEVPVALISEVRLPGGVGSSPVMSALAVGVHGAGGDSAGNLAAIADELERILSGRVALARTNPATVLSPPNHSHCFRIRQCPVRPSGLEHLEVPTVWNGFFNPLAHLIAAAAAMRSELRIRVSFLSTQPTLDDWAYLDSGTAQLAQMASIVDPNRVDQMHVLERAMASYRHLAERLDGPLWAGELAISSPEPISWAQRQLLAGSITSARGLHWSDDGPHLLDTGPLRGGFDTEDLPQDLVHDAHHRGLPVHGGVRRHNVHDLFTATGLLWDAPAASTNGLLEDRTLDTPRLAFG